MLRRVTAVPSSAASLASFILSARRCRSTVLVYKVAASKLAMNSCPSSPATAAILVHRRPMASNRQTGEHAPSKTEHSHSHGSFSSIFHSHGDDHPSHSHGAEHLLHAFRGAGDRGSQITLVGLFANIGLTASKGTAGWVLNSASLMADAAHSLSDLLGDFVTLFCWRWSRKPPSQKYPYGFDKFETLGTTTVSLLLIGGALGIGFHSYYLLVEALSPTIASMSPGFMHSIFSTVASSNLTESLAHAHSHEHALDPNAAWFSLAGIFTKEWLYRITKRVADEEKSSVLLANALHHRSDAYTSIVAFVAIVGSWWAPWLPLDPIGGLLVSVVILGQGLSLMRSSLLELMDAGVSPQTSASLTRALEPLLADAPPSASSSSPHPIRIIHISDLRAKRTGTHMDVDLSAHVPASLSVQEASYVEEDIRSRLSNIRSEIRDVRVRFVPIELKNGSCHG